MLYIHEMVRCLVAAAMPFSECGRVMQTLPHAVFVFLDEFLLVVLIFHPVLTWDDKIGCDSTLWTRPAPKKKKKDYFCFDPVSLSDNIKWL